MNKRLTLTGYVERLRKDVSSAGGFTIYFLHFRFTPNQSSVFLTPLKACGEFWGEPHATHAQRVKEGSIVKITGCLKDDNCFDLELLETF